MKLLPLVLLTTVSASGRADEPSDRIFFQATGSKPVYSVRIGERIVGVVAGKSEHRGDDYRVVALQSVEGSWKKDAEKRIGDGDSYYEVVDTFSSLDVGARPYLYFSVNETYKGSATAGLAAVRFTLVDVQTLELFTLVYAGEERAGDKLKGAFEDAPELSRRPELLRVLQERAAQCARIFKGEKSAWAWLDRWQDMNSSLPDVFLRRSFPPRGIRWEYSERNPMKEAPAGSIVGEQENARYRIVAYFRNSVIGFDKSLKKYFPIWAEHCNHGCNKEIRALTSDVLELVYNETEGKVLYVDLKRKTVELREE